MQSRPGTAFTSPSFAMVSLAVATILLKQPVKGPEVRLRELARRDAWQMILRQENESAWIELYARPNPPVSLSSR